MSHSAPPPVQLKVTPGDKYAIVVARWNHEITGVLKEGAVTTLAEHGAQSQVVYVPGSFELPQMAHRIASTGDYVSVICLGVVVKGDTRHDEYINHAVAQGITQAGISTGVPILFGVLTVENQQQAIDRAGGKYGNKGSEAALAAIEMVQAMREFPLDKSTL